jgi:hypothetical protein
MYTDYHAEMYFLETDHALPALIEGNDGVSPLSASGHTKSSCHVSRTLLSSGSGSPANNLTASPETPAN